MLTALLALGTGRPSSRWSATTLRQQIARSTPESVPPGFDCRWRQLAMQWAPKLQPWLNATQQRQLYDALELETLCNQPLTGFVPPSPSVPHAARRLGGSESLTVYVDPAHGDDGNSGALASPLQTIVAALNKTRRSARGRATIALRGGTHYLSESVELEARDSGLTIAAHEGEEAIVSGGVLLQGLKWTPSRVGGAHVASVAGYALPRGIPALLHRGQRATRARYPNANPELDLFPKGYISGDTQWLPPEYKGVACDPARLCGVSKNVTIPVTDAWHGMYQNYTVGVGGACDRYDPPLSPWCSGDFYLLRQFPEMHTRSPSGVRASPHLPHAALYSPTSHEGAVVHAWRPGHWFTWMFELDSTLVPGQTVDHWVVFPDTNAISGRVPSPKGGAPGVVYLGDFGSRDGCAAACNSSSAACHSWTWHEPDFPDPSWARGCYGLTDGAWSPSHEDHVTSARGPHTEAAAYTFAAGGHQGGEGNEEAGEWFIENVKEELDAPNEFFYDAEAGLLYFRANASSPPDSSVVVPTLATLFSVKGSQSDPVRDVVFDGLTLTASRPTFMENRTNPSGGDWALEREGAIRLEGTEGVRIANSYFTRLDSNGISINGYNRHTTVDRNEFVWLGQSAITSWGNTVGNDGTDGNQPRFSAITNNLCHEIGHIQKQSSFYFQATTSEATLSGNIVYNIPRAAINFNDGFGGGADVSRNLLFNTCRESGDHGAFNSWDRLPYITTVATGKPSTVPKLNDVHNNMVVANYAADGGCLDNDDGSAYYSIHHNFCVYGGHKQNFDGHSKHASFNVYVYPQVYGVKCIDEEQEGMDTHTSGLDGLPPAGYAESYESNVCILPAAGDPFYVGGGVLSSPKRFATGMKLKNNTVYVPGGNATVVLSGETATLQSFQASFDPTSRVSGDMPSYDRVIAWGKQLIGM